jgi:hypothetical protein
LDISGAHRLPLSETLSMHVLGELTGFDKASDKDFPEFFRAVLP